MSFLIFLFFTDDDRKIILESRASYDVEKEWILFQQKDIGFVTMEDELIRTSLEI